MSRTSPSKESENTNEENTPQVVVKQSKDRQEKQKQKKDMKKQIFRRLFLVLVGLILGLNIYLANAGAVLGNKLPMPFGYGLANVLSGSMEPTFSKGTLLLVKDTRDVNEGDIVVYQSKNELIVHRIISITDREVITQGDANSVADEPFDKTQIKGKVIGWIPMLGNVAAVLKTPAVVIVILILAFVLIEGSFRKKKEADDQQLGAIKAEIRRLKTELEEAGIREDEEKENRKDEEPTEDIENTGNREER